MITPEGRAMLVHALAHIEFNAMNLALDALWRFPDLPAEYYTDWLRVAREEATHFAMLQAHLQVLGHTYGDFPGHDSLWEMVDKTRGDVLARMALVPRTLEARGLDAIPPCAPSWRRRRPGRRRHPRHHPARRGGPRGNRQPLVRLPVRPTGLELRATYAELARRYEAPTLRGPFNLEARRRAGFSELELADLPS
jgi:uncharacterized ferritin-like protein (DUF455 family)